MDTKAIRDTLAKIREQWAFWKYPVGGGYEIFEKESRATICVTHPTEQNGNFDGSVIANLPTWLQQLLDENERLQTELSQRKAERDMQIKLHREKISEVAQLQQEIKQLQADKAVVVVALKHFVGGNYENIAAETALWHILDLAAKTLESIESGEKG